ncbi:MAG TPA: uroporphyrinogen-III synthase [Acidobacteriota bacterium]|nr:uroporphyrinogen-III synthase [Acidobacteriota bacterium]
MHQPSMALPLQGKRIVITRAESQAAQFAQKLSAQGAEVLSFPTIAFVEPASWEVVDEALNNLSRYDWLVLTSTNGVKFFWKRLELLGLTTDLNGKPKVCAIGKATAEALSRRNVRVDLIPQEFKAEGAIESLVAASGGPEKIKGMRILLPRAQMAREVLPVELGKLGVQVDVVEVYQTVRPSVETACWQTLFLNGQVDVVTFTSASTVNHFAEMFPEVSISELLQHTTVACIGPITTEAAQKLGIIVHIQPTEYTTDALAEAIIGMKN